MQAQTTDMHHLRGNHWPSGSLHPGHPRERGRGQAHSSETSTVRTRDWGSKEPAHHTHPELQQGAEPHTNSHP